MAALLLVRARTALSLGLGNVARVADYRLRLAAGMHPVQRIAPGPTPRAPFLAATATPSPWPVPEAWWERANYFAWLRPALDGGPPDWHRNPLDGTRASGTDRPWWVIPDFDPAAGDIKAIWEASRFDWAVNLAQRTGVGDAAALERLNAWLADWCAANPPYHGHNWKCAQEASVRVMHLAVAAFVLSQTRSPLPGLIDLLTVHLRRIAPTLGYAIGQDNNHGTSEAAALFVGGSWLETLGRPEAGPWHQLGRALLEDRVGRLIAADGSFSQHSVNYHRLVLDTLSLVELWRRHLRLPPFSGSMMARAAAATAWLRAMVDPATGDAPNLGANDGANLLPLTDAEYRDYRPAVHLATALFEGRCAFGGPGPWQAHLGWLGLARPGETASPPPSRLYDDGGYAVVRCADATAVLRYPRFRFRPGHADALHLDLSVAGENLLRDGGSFSYAADAEWLTYFCGVRGHNTVQFDDREQMPRLGRFLWGSWLKTKAVEPIREADGAATVAAAYEDARGASHTRRIALRRGGLVVQDTLAGFSRRAVLRWRLRPGPWTLRRAAVTDGRHHLEVSANVPLTRCELVSGWESRYYLQKTAIPVLEVEVASPGSVTSEYRWIG
ncbi:MAG: heparinase [Gemmatimonadetes bacterium 13_1_40CM_4_69_8]|nr:MAG: heparinase [Gemmatimonadetes bacterium 13_1_40CM_4_69_8]